MQLWDWVWDGRRVEWRWTYLATLQEHGTSAVAIDVITWRPR